MTPGIIADSIVNLCSAIGLSVAMVMLYRRDPKSPLTRRLLLALGVAALLFFVRGAAWWMGSVWLDRLSLIPAALVPLGALNVTEGLLRRHAPRPLKMVVVIGGIGLGLAGAFGPERFSALHSLLLSLFQLAGFAACGLLLVMRDRATLLASENRSIGRVAFGAIIVIPFIATDFQVLTPDIPAARGHGDSDRRRRHGDSAPGPADDGIATFQLGAARYCCRLCIAGRRCGPDHEVLRHLHVGRARDRPDG
jgi:hypothetical protein